jgi:hypothetical protein
MWTSELTVVVCTLFGKQRQEDFELKATLEKVRKTLSQKQNKKGWGYSIKW